MSFPWIIWGPEGEQFSTYAAPTRLPERRYALGTQLWLPDGRKYVFVENGGTEIAAGRLCQSPVPGANFDELAVAAAAAVGATSIQVTNGATAITADQFADGYISIEDDAGEGHIYKIDSQHDAVAASGTFTVPLAPGVSVQVALTTSTTAGLLQSPYQDIIIHPSPPTAKLVGVTPTTLEADRYGWLQFAGPCSLLTDGTLLIFQQVVASDAVDGAVEPADSAITDGTPPTGHGELVMVGDVLEVAATTEHSIVNLRLG